MDARTLKPILLLRFSEDKLEVHEIEPFDKKTFTSRGFIARMSYEPPFSIKSIVKDTSLRFAGGVSVRPGMHASMKIRPRP
eukprot:4451666-Amphidinium_carterae.2